MWFYYLVFAIVSLGGLFRFQSVYGKSFLIASSILLIIIAAFRGSIGHDYEVYVLSYQYVSDGYPVLMEPSFVLISWLVLFTVNKIELLFLIYAILGVCAKVEGIRRLSPFIMLSLLLYISNFFLLHEMTQIRAGVATGFFLIAVPNIAEKKFIKYFAYILLASFFHLSALVALPFYFLNQDRLNKYVFLGLIPLSYVIHLLHFDILSLVSRLPFAYTQDKLDIIERISTSGEAIRTNVLNVLQVSRVFFACLVVLLSHRLKSSSPHIFILIKLYAFSVCAMPLFSTVPELAFRLGELVGVVEIVLLPFLIYVFKEKRLTYFLLCCYALAVLMLNLHYNKLLQPYF